MVWLGMPLPPAWKLMLYFVCIGMFGVGVGMLYTPILVDRLQLDTRRATPSPTSCARSPTRGCSRRSIGKLGGGTAAGIARGGVVSSSRSPFVGAIGVSASTIGAGIIVGSRIAVPALVMGGIGALLTPYLRSDRLAGARTIRSARSASSSRWP